MDAMDTTRQTLAQQAPALPTNRAFVVQFSRQVGESSDHWAGRIEHIVSGRATHFTSWAELQTFMKQILAQVEEKPP
jgi:hypothetical protein